MPEEANTPRFDAQIVSCTPDEYFKRPGFSASRAKTVIAQSPAHAKAFVERAPSVELDRGSVLHRLVLGQGKEYEVLDFDDWRTKDARAERDRVRMEGKVPVKARDFEAWSTAANRIGAELLARGLVLNGQSECVIEWYEETPHGPLLCKAMFDHLWIALGRILELKITENAAPSSVERTAENLGYAIGWAAYTRALVALSPGLDGRTKFLFAFCEPEEPWAVNLCEPDGEFRTLGERRWLRACATWAKCKADKSWPAYGDGINYLSAPTWALAKEALEP